MTNPAESKQSTEKPASVTSSQPAPVKQAQEPPVTKQPPVMTHSQPPAMWQQPQYRQPPPPLCVPVAVPVVPVRPPFSQPPNTPITVTGPPRPALTPPTPHAPSASASTSPFAARVRQNIIVKTAKPKPNEETAQQTQQKMYTMETPAMQSVTSKEEFKRMKKERKAAKAQERRRKMNQARKRNKQQKAAAAAAASKSETTEASATVKEAQAKEDCVLVTETTNAVAKQAASAVEEGIKAQQSDVRREEVGNSQQPNVKDEEIKREVNAPVYTISVLSASQPLDPLTLPPAPTIEEAQQLADYKANGMKRTTHKKKKKFKEMARKQRKAERERKEAEAKAEAERAAAQAITIEDDEETGTAVKTEETVETQESVEAAVELENEERLLEVKPEADEVGTSEKIQGEILEEVDEDALLREDDDGTENVGENEDKNEDVIQDSNTALTGEEQPSHDASVEILAQDGPTAELRTTGDNASVAIEISDSGSDVVSVKSESNDVIETLDLMDEALAKQGSHIPVLRARVATERSAPPTVAMQSSAPPTVAMQSSAPPTVAMQSSAPPTVAMQSSAPPTVAMQSSAPPTVAMQSSAPPVTVASSEESAAHLQASAQMNFRCGLCSNMIISGDKPSMLKHCAALHKGFHWKIYCGTLQRISKNDFKATCNLIGNPNIKEQASSAGAKTPATQAPVAATASKSAPSGLDIPVPPRKQFVGGVQSSASASGEKTKKGKKSTKAAKFFMCLLCTSGKATMLIDLEHVTSHFDRYHPQATPSYARGSLEKLAALHRTLAQEHESEQPPAPPPARDDDVIMLEDSQENPESDDVMIVSDTEDEPACEQGGFGAQSERLEREVLELIDGSDVGAHLGRMAILEKHRAHRLQRLTVQQRIDANLARKAELARDLQCPACCHEANSIEQLFRHLDTVHTNVEVMTQVLRCFLCGFDFKMKDRRQLRAHLRCVHGFEVASSSVVTLFSVKVQPVVIITKCEQCKFKTVSGDIMNRHHCDARPPHGY